MKLYVPSLVGVGDSVGNDSKIAFDMSRNAHHYTPALHSRR
ncbi:hypothetical protein MITS9509_02176 [Synechococcus sp. MIT S9509]|nr:hypothetical protein MITS9504_01610 [Synechococcus sp. MIT S9504]KZR91541.1 hypothetical protein MITS9509_02176 [Synechococcus sp. MIT S9509]